jgi:hypothetical protein
MGIPVFELGRTSGPGGDQQGQITKLQGQIVEAMSIIETLLMEVGRKNIQGSNRKVL